MMSKRKRQKIIILIAIIAFLAIQFYYYNIKWKSEDVEIIGTDPYMRLVRVEEFNESYDWYDSVIDRSNAPFGDELHWTRALDVLLFTIAKPLSIFMPFSKALLYTGILLSPLLGCLTILSLAWMSKPVIEGKHIKLIYLVFLSQPMVYVIFSFGRPDHHSLILFVFVLTIGFMVRVVKPKGNDKQLILLSFLMAYSFWISVESIIMIVMIFLVMSLLWLSKGMDYLQKSIKIAGLLSLFSAMFLIIERPINMWRVKEYDKISIVYVLFFIIITAVLFSVNKVADYFKSIERNKYNNTLVRSLLLTVFGIIGATVMVLIFPDFIKGPFANVNSDIIPVWLDLVSEVQSILSMNLRGLGMVLLYLGIPTLSIIYLIFRMIDRNEKYKETYFFFLLGILIYGLLSLYQIRWVGYICILSLVPAVLMFNSVIEKIIKGKPKSLVPFLRVVTLVVLLLGSTLISSIVLLSDSHKTTVTLTPGALKELCEWLNENEEELGSEKTILTFLDFGPEILYRTDHRVISSPYHRNDSGIMFNYEIMTSKDTNNVYNLLQERMVDWIIISPNSSEKIFYQVDEKKDNFYEKLLNNDLPIWLKEVKLPERNSEFRLFLIEINEMLY